VAVVSSNEVSQGRKSTGDWQYNRTHTRAWLVETNSTEDDGYDVLVGAASASPDPIPTIFQRHPSDTNAFAKSATCDPAPGSVGKSWLVVVTYDNKVDIGQGDFSGGNGAPQPDPTLRRPRVSWGFAQFSKRVTTDRDGNAVLNSAGQAFDPPPERDFSRRVLTITRIESDYDDATAEEYQDAVNTDEFYGRAPGTAKMTSITASDHWENGDHYWEVTYIIHFDTAHLEEDESVANDGNRKRLLDGEGGLLADDADAVYLDFETYPEAAFGNLNLE
jgi:hypothetical protein